MATVRKYLLAIVFALLSLCCFVFVGCDQVNIDGGDGKVTVRIEGAIDFTFDCELKEKKALSTPQEVADTVNRISNGAVESADVAETAVDGAIYTILIKGIPEETNLREYFRTVEENYLKLYSAWKNFPDSPVKYTTKDGKDVLVYVSTEKAEDNEIMIYVFFFEEGAVDELAETMGGNHGGEGGEQGETNVIKINGAIDFTGNCELKETTTLSTPQEVADTVNRISNGAVESADVAETAVDGAIYTILIKGIPEETNLREFFRTVEENYLKLYSAWKNFPDSPVKYTTNNGKDVLIYVSTEKAEDNELMIYVFFFEEGAVDELAETMGGGEGGDHGDHGNETTVEIEYAYDFVYDCELIQKYPYGLARQDMADTVSALTDGRVSASDLLYRVAPESSTMYRISIKDAAEQDNVEEYLRLIGEQYLAKFTSWQGFSEVPVKYKMENGKELAVYVSTENAAEYELTIYVFFFEEGTMAILSGNTGDDNGGEGGDHGGEQGGGGQGETNTIEINFAYDFTGNCELIGSRLFMNAKEAATKLSEISGGRVKSDSVIGSVVDGGGEYKIFINGIPEGAKLQEYIKKVANDYLANYSAWKTFPDSPVKYTTNNGVDVLIYVSYEYYAERQIYICVFLFDAGAVDALAESMSGGQGGQGGEGGSGSGGSGEQGGDEMQTVPVSIMFDNGNVSTENFTKGSTVYFAQLYPDYDVYADASLSHVLGIDEGVTIVEGLTIFLRTKQQTPTTITLKCYDVSTDGDLTSFENTNYSYGTKMKFSWAGFVLYSDEECTQEIDPNQEVTLTEDTIVYRKDNLDRVPVFFNVHYYTNGVEESIGANDVFFRGELLSIDKNFIDKSFGYEFYYDMGKTQKVFEDDNVIVVRETDDKKNVYGFKEDRRRAVLTFMLDGNELCKTLIDVGCTIGDYCYLYLGTSTYHVKDCSDKDTPIRGNTTITITDYEKTNSYAETIHLCYNGDVKRTYVNYLQIDSEHEISERDGYYTDASCTQPFVGTVNSTTTLYREFEVNFDRCV
ncbi:MAG: hypothetical protein IK147_04285 [Clostridia bacterium]|nr:hypothetical protein [Clostridia bacterium]